MAARRLKPGSWEWLERELVKRIQRADANLPSGQSLVGLLAGRSAWTPGSRKPRRPPIGRRFQ
ncbi:MAG TPA: hypothetical protein VI455_07475 [Terriglobia bacterium]